MVIKEFVLKFTDLAVEAIEEQRKNWTPESDIETYMTLCILDRAKEHKILSENTPEYYGEKEEQQQEETQLSKDQRSSIKELYSKERIIHSNTHPCEAEGTGTGDCSRQGNT